MRKLLLALVACGQGGKIAPQLERGFQQAIDLPFRAEQSVADVDDLPFAPGGINNRDAGRPLLNGVGRRDGGGVHLE